MSRDAEIIATSLNAIAAAMRDNATATRELIEVYRYRFERDQRLADLYAEHTEMQMVRERGEMEKVVLFNDVQRLIAERLGESK